MAKRSHTPVAGTGPQSAPAIAQVSKWGLHIKLALVLAIASLLLNANTINNSFTMDDSVMIVHNEYVQKGVPGIPLLLSTPHQRGHWVNPNDEYRPLSLVLFAIEYQFCELDPLPYHLANILLFAGCVVLLFLFLHRLFGGKNITGAFIASLLFALHPIHTEVVANVKSSDEMLSFVLVFSALLVFIKYVQTGKTMQLLAGVFCFFLSLLAKETTITFLAIIPVVFYLFINDNKQRSKHIVLGIVASTAAFLLLRYAVLSYYDANSLPQISLIENALAMKGLSAESRLATAILIMGQYLKLQFVPYPLICDYSYNYFPYTHFSDPVVLLSLLAYVALAVVAVRLLLRDRRNLVAFGILFFLATISLFSNIIIPIKATMGERFLFFPSVGFCIVVALGLQWLAARLVSKEVSAIKHPVLLGVLIPLCAVWAYISIDRNSNWVSNYVLYSTDAPKAPTNSRLNYFRGYEAFTMYHAEVDMNAKKQLLDEAIFYFQRSVRTYPEYSYALADLAAAFFTNGQYDSAEVYNKIGIRLDKKNLISRNNLSGVYIKTERFAKDIEFSKETIALFPQNVDGYADLGFSYMKLSQNDSAVKYLKQGIAVNPSFQNSYNILGFVYEAMGNTDSMLKYRGIAQQMAR